MTLDPNIGGYLVQAFAENKASHAYIVRGDRQFVPQLLKECALVTMCNSHNGADNCDNCRKVIDGTHQDVISLPQDTTKNRLTVGDMALLVDESNKRPVDNGDRRGFLINAVDSVQGIGADIWQNKLLKTLEEPIDGVFIFIGVTDSEALLPTVRSRCQTLSLGRLTVSQVKHALRQNGFDERSCEIAAAMSGGNVGSGMAILNNPQLFKSYERAADVCINMSSTKNALKYVAEITSDKNTVNDLLGFWSVLLAESLYYRISPQLCELTALSSVTEQVCKSYTIDAATACIELLNQAKKRLDDGGNLQVVIDTLAGNILEVKYRCRL